MNNYQKKNLVSNANQPLIEIGGRKVEENEVIFFDIETVPKYENFEIFMGSEPEMAMQFESKAEALGKYYNITETIEECYRNRAGLFAEYNKVICVSLGCTNKAGDFKLTTVSFENEEETIAQTFALLDHLSTRKYLCGQNINQFDIPMLVKKGFIYGLIAPKILYKYGAKPWELNTIDIKQIWQTTSSLNDASLATISLSMGIPSPKTDLSGDKVKDFYYSGRINEIINYCERDVECTYLLFKKFQHLSKVTFEKG